MDDLLYIQKLKEQADYHESLCVRCGQCCGSHDPDPCANLGKDEQGRCYCRVYENRLGAQKTVSGKNFSCVLIRDIVQFYPPYSICPYLR